VYFFAVGAGVKAAQKCRRETGVRSVAMNGAAIRRKKRENRGLTLMALR
jgi:hypothetical protein